jgi:hypothetical protein
MYSYSYLSYNFHSRAAMCRCSTLSKAQFSSRCIRRTMSFAREEWFLSHVVTATPSRTYPIAPQSCSSHRPARSAWRKSRNRPRYCRAARVHRTQALRRVRAHVLEMYSCCMKGVSERIDCVLFAYVLCYMASLMLWVFYAVTKEEYIVQLSSCSPMNPNLKLVNQLIVHMKATE